MFLKLKFSFSQFMINFEDQVYLHFLLTHINPLAPDAHYSERQDKPFSLQILTIRILSIYS